MTDQADPIDYSHVTRISPVALAELAALNERVNHVCWSHDAHRQGEIRDEDDDVVGYFCGLDQQDAAPFIVSAKNNMDGLLALVADLTHERDEARQWVRNLTAQECVLTCVYCGRAYPPGTPAHGSPVLTAHIEQCEKHPLRAIRVAARHLAWLMETRKQTQADQDAIDAVKLALGETPTPSDA